jgi:hypothetical protein
LPSQARRRNSQQSFLIASRLFSAAAESRAAPRTLAFFVANITEILTKTCDEPRVLLRKKRVRLGGDPEITRAEVMKSGV